MMDLVRCDKPAAHCISPGTMCRCRIYAVMETFPKHVRLVCLKCGYIKLTTSSYFRDHFKPVQRGYIEEVEGVA